MDIYTPIFESILSQPQIGLTEAAVFGAIWRYARGDKKRCTAGPEKIGDRVGVSANTVRRAIQKLVDQELITDLTPDTKHAAHEYLPTEKASSLVEQVTQNGQPDTDEVTQIEQPEVTQNDEPKPNRLPKMGRQVTQNGQPRLPKMGNKERIKKEEKITPNGAGDKKPITPSQAMFGKLAEICKIDWRICTNKQKGELNQSEKLLREEVGATPEELAGFETWWYPNDWRGKRGDPPKPAQVREEWGKFKASQHKQPIRISAK